MFFTQGEVLMGKVTGENITARSFTVLIFAMGWALCGRPQLEYEQESVMPLLSRSPLNV